ncbi:hypothetical protein AGMMS50256_37800 [Betaproteobacteria bacterium]|nr:hypothetical protein AGMMS50256_37800 [Betaproteobacteria bacterium]
MNAVEIIEIGDRLEIIELAQQGSPGRPGNPGPAGGLCFDRIAAGSLSALRVVWEDEYGVVRALDAADAAHIDRLAGLTTSAAASAGQSLTVQRFGVVDADGLGLTPGRVWLGAAGSLTQTPPATGFDVLVGYATADRRLTLDFSEAILLEA